MATKKWSGELTHRCGHTVKGDFTPAQVRGLPHGDCRPCCDAAEAAAAAKARERAEKDTAEFYGRADCLQLPEIIGSEKQVAWAIQIRRGVLAAVLEPHFCRKIAEHEQFRNAQLTRHKKLSQADADRESLRVIVSADRVLGTLTTNTSAKFWIDEARQICGVLGEGQLLPYGYAARAAGAAEGSVIGWVSRAADADHEDYRDLRRAEMASLPVIRDVLFAPITDAEIETAAPRILPYEGRSPYQTLAAVDPEPAPVADTPAEAEVQVPAPLADTPAALPDDDVVKQEFTKGGSAAEPEIEAVAGEADPDVTAEPEVLVKSEFTEEPPASVKSEFTEEPTAPVKSEFTEVPAAPEGEPAAALQTMPASAAEAAQDPSAPPRSVFSVRLRAARTAAKISMADLAQRAGLKDRQLVYAYESGRVSPNLDLTARLAAVLQTHPAWLAGWSEAGAPVGL